LLERRGFSEGGSLFGPRSPTGATAHGVCLLPLPFEAGAIFGDRSQLL
jgi:hypothetical protein